MMLASGPARKVIIHLNEDASSAHDFLYREVLQFLFENDVAGATMIRPGAGFGSQHRLHTAGASDVEGEHLPVRIEFIESVETVERLLPALCSLVSDGLVEMHPTTVVKSARRAEPI